MPCTNPVQSEGIVIIGTASKLWGLKVGTEQAVDSGFHGICYTGFNPVAINDSSEPVPGDGNGDYCVDGHDFIIWLNHFGQSTFDGASDGDFNQNSIVDIEDYNIWVSNYLL